jgi:hypothetical protein
VHPSNPKNRITQHYCPICRAKIEDAASLHAKDEFGPYVGHYVVYECGLVVVLKRGKPECWNQCEMGEKVVNAEVVNARDLTPQEIEARRRRELQELSEFVAGGRFRHVRPIFFTISTTDTGSL